MLLTLPAIDDNEHANLMSLDQGHGGFRVPNGY